MTSRNEPLSKLDTGQMISRKTFLMMVAIGTIAYAGSLIANVLIGAVAGIIVGMSVSLAAYYTRSSWSRKVLLLLAIASWSLVALLVSLHCLGSGPAAACESNPLVLTWQPSLFYFLCWLAWITSRTAGTQKGR